MATAKKVATNALDGEDVRVREQDGDLKGDRRDDSGRLLFWARRVFTYLNVDVERGQIFAVGDGRNDRKLDRLGYMVALRKTDQVFPCRHCAAQFVDLNTLNAHGDRQHADRGLRTNLPDSRRGITVDDNAAEAQRFERDQKVADQVAPLNLDKTEAARGVARA